MTAFRSKSATSYKRYTPVQLAANIRKLQKLFWHDAKKPANPKNIQRCKAIAREIKKIALALRSKTVQNINVKIRLLKTQFAQKQGIKQSSPKAYSPAAKRLKAKIVQINKCRRISTLMKLCTELKLASFKNPHVSKAKRKPLRSAHAKRTTGRKHSHHVKYKRHTKTLKKEMHKLQRRNSFMRKLVNQFRRKVAKLQRAYRARHAQPRWRVIKGHGPSNVVRLHRRTHATSWNRQAQRRAG